MSVYLRGDIDSFDWFTNEDNATKFKNKKQAQEMIDKLIEYDLRFTSMYKMEIIEIEQKLVQKEFQWD